MRQSREIFLAEKALSCISHLEIAAPGLARFKNMYLFVKIPIFFSVIIIFSPSSSAASRTQLRRVDTDSSERKVTTGRQITTLGWPRAAVGNESGPAPGLRSSVTLGTLPSRAQGL